MFSLFSFRRAKDRSERPPTEQEVMHAGEAFIRKEKLVDQFEFLPPEMNKAAKDTALNRFLEILFHYLRR